MTAPLLYRCSPLRAWISEAQCQANTTRAERGDYLLRDTCPGCPGVRALSRRAGLEPRDLHDFRAAQRNAQQPPQRRS